MNLQELRDKKNGLSGQASEILKTAATDNRLNLRSDEEEKFDKIHDEISSLDATIKRIEKQAAVDASLAESSGRRSEPSKPSNRADVRAETAAANAADRSEGLRSWLLAGSSTAKQTPEMREAAARAGFNLNASTIDLLLPKAPLTSLRSEDVRSWEERAQSVGTGSEGGFSVPDEMMRALEVSMLAFGGVRQVATVYRTSSGAALPIPTTNDTANKGAILGENSAASEQAVTFGQLVLDSYKYSSKYVLVSVELLQDSSINVPELIGRLLGERLGRITNDHFTTGTGSSQPNGIVTAAGAGVTATSLTATTTYSFLMDLVHSVDPAYRNNGRFMLSDAALKMVRKVLIPQYSGDTAGAPLWQPDFRVGAPDQLLGFPYTINQSMTSPATAVKSIIFGDLSKYIIREVRDFTLQRLDERFAEYHQAAFLAFLRTDGDLLDAGTDPVKYHLQG
jgi:HK97 family phage major capsid protein